MHPIFYELFSGHGLGLRNLVIVMNGNVVNPARVYVKDSPKIFRCHGCAFYVPAGEPPTPWRVPTSLFIKLPEREVPRVMLFGGDADARMLRRGASPKNPVLREFCNIKINPLGRFVGVPFIQKRRHIRDLLRNMFPRSWEKGWESDGERFQVFYESRCIFFREYLHILQGGFHAFPFQTRGHLVFS